MSSAFDLRTLLHFSTKQTREERHKQTKNVNKSGAGDAEELLGILLTSVASAAGES